jgi:hypothetical protein
VPTPRRVSYRAQPLQGPRRPSVTGVSSPPWTGPWPEVGSDHTPSGLDLARGLPYTRRMCAGVLLVRRHVAVWRPARAENGTDAAAPVLLADPGNRRGLNGVVRGHA